MISTQFSSEAYQLADEYHLGEPIRIYRTNKWQDVRSSTWTFLGVSAFFLFAMLIQNHFHFGTMDVIFYGLCTGILGIAALFVFIPLLRVPTTTVYICASGFIIHTPRSIEPVRWEEIERVKLGEAKSPCLVFLTDPMRPDILLSKHIRGCRELSEEIELKAQLVHDTEQTVGIERRFERVKSGQVERQQTGKMLYQVHRQYLATKDPHEAMRLGEEYRLGESLDTYRSGFCSLFQRATLLHLAWALPLAFFLVNDPQHGIQPFWPVGCIVSLALFVVFFLAPRVAGRNVRLHIYTEGFIFVHSSLDIIRWEQIEKVVYSISVFFNFCTFHLKTGEKLALSAYLERQDDIKHILDPKIKRKEVYPTKKEKREWRDIGHLAD